MLNCSGHRYASDRFLLVGSQHTWQAILRKLLERQGHKTMVADYGDAALRAAQTFDPDVIIINLADDASACDTARQIRELAIGDMFTLVALGDSSTWPAADFDLVMDGIDSYACLIEALNEMDEAWTVRAPIELENKLA